MRYVDSNLMAGETVVHRAVLHWVIYVPGIVLLPVAIGLLFLIDAWIKSGTTELAVTNKRVIAKRGLVRRDTLEINLAKIETIGVEQSIFGRVFNYGTVVVVGTGGTKEEFSDIVNPTAFRKAVQTQSH